MTDKFDKYGHLTDATTLKIQRMLPGTVERVWAYLTESELRETWLAAGDMPLVPNGRFELVWRNDDLSDAPANRPDGFPEEDRMESRIIEVEPPHRLAFSWADGGTVHIELAQRGDKVLLTLVHSGLGERKTRLEVAAGWHTHLDILGDIAEGRAPTGFWDAWASRRNEYAGRMPA